MTKRVVGLDPSIIAFGVCLHDGSTLTVPTKEKDGDLRLQQIAYALRCSLLDQADLAVMEDPAGMRGTPAKAVYKVLGVTACVLLDLGLPVAKVNQTTLKRFATGNPKADKAAMIMAAYKRTGGAADFTGPGMDDNQCDAWWLRQMGLARLGKRELDLPKDQLKALDAADWKGWP